MFTLGLVGAGLGFAGCVVYQWFWKRWDERTGMIYLIVLIMLLTVSGFLLAEGMKCT